MSSVPEPSTPKPERFQAVEYLRVMRPDHWLKNVFILFGHMVAIGLLPGLASFSAAPRLAMLMTLSLIPACLIASANYILNEILDAPFDRTHPTKKYRAVPAGLVSIPLLWVLMGALIVLGFALALALFNISYTLSLLLLLLSGVVYNVPPLRLKDRAFLDVIAESFNNPIRLWLGWYALAPATSFPPLSILLSWWFFGALLMAGKRYSEFRFIGDADRSARYRKSFAVYTEQSLIISMITHANLFCFTMGVAITTYRPNLLFVFPIVAAAVCVYFNRAMTTEAARLEPEELLKNPWIIGATIVTVLIGSWLAWLPIDLPKLFGLLRLIPGE
ncbi:MAG: UbiA family prenyltransferase [Verrucomicrobiia bacterium]